jgi:hypothetical protein
VLEHVCLVEIANAMSTVAEATAGLTEPDLKREAKAVFGGRRMTIGSPRTAVVRYHRRTSSIEGFLVRGCWIHPYSEAIQ